VNRLAAEEHDICQILATLPEIVRRIEELLRSECDRDLYPPELGYGTGLSRSQTWIPAHLAEVATTVYAENRNLEMDECSSIRLPISGSVARI
jgi:hypothetical protein